MSGKMRRVPRLTKPAAMPAEVRVAASVMGSQARTEILRQLALTPRTAPELGTAIGLSGVSVWRHLGVMEVLGLVRADHDPGKRLGVTVRWSIDKNRTAALAQWWTDYATGRRSPVPEDGS